MKIYKHEGGGHYIGSCVIVVCETELEADGMIRKILDKEGLDKEQTKITEHEIMTNEIIYINNGDY